MKALSVMLTVVLLLLAHHLGARLKHAGLLPANQDRRYANTEAKVASRPVALQATYAL
jgi:hypothetical protein